MSHLVFNEAVFRLWEKYFSPEEDLYVPLILPPLVRHGILFIGNNPSFSPTGFKRFLSDTPLANIDPSSFFHWKNRTSLDFETAIQIERVAKDRYPYFNKFRDISEYTSLEWEHIDLFFFRETSQNNFNKRIFDKHGLTQFGKDQVDLSRWLVHEIEPKIIVVVNAFASKIFETVYEAIFDESLGHHKVALNGRSVPVFLGSMLTGQRAMDLHSYQRLKWHIKQVAQT